jgi:hypothetical protein
VECPICGGGLHHYLTTRIKGRIVYEEASEPEGSEPVAGAGVATTVARISDSESNPSSSQNNTKNQQKEKI